MASAVARAYSRGLTGARGQGRRHHWSWKPFDSHVQNFRSNISCFLNIFIMFTCCVWFASKRNAAVLATA